MPERTAAHLPLLPHPQSAAAATVPRLAACAELAGEGSLRLRYVLAADARRVRIPASAPDAGRADKLWAHTCFEAFVGLRGVARAIWSSISRHPENGRRIASSRTGRA